MWQSIMEKATAAAINLRTSALKRGVIRVAPAVEDEVAMLDCAKLPLSDTGLCVWRTPVWFGFRNFIPPERF